MTNKLILGLILAAFIMIGVVASLPAQAESPVMPLPVNCALLPLPARNLTLGSAGSDVGFLQQYLITGGYLRIAAATNFFGPLTKTAVASWQAEHNVANPGTGYFGALSRAKLKALSKCDNPVTQSSITLTSPNGSETWLANSVQDIKWSMSNAAPGAKIDLYLTYPGSDCRGLCPAIAYPPDIVLDRNIDAAATYHWIVATDINNKLITIGNWKVKVCAAGSTSDNNCDTSDAPFTITNSLDTGACYVGGCSAQLCSGQPDLASTCEYRAEYSCYRQTGAKCERQASGQCGWTPSAALASCLANPPL